MERYGESIDTPGEYLENRHFYNALIMSAVDAGTSPWWLTYIGIPGDSSRVCRHFREKVIGIITKIHEAGPEQVKRAQTQLKEAGVSRIFRVDTPKGTGIAELSEFLNRERGTK